MDEIPICAQWGHPIEHEAPEKIVYLGAKPICSECLLRGVKEIVPQAAKLASE